MQNKQHNVHMGGRSSPLEHRNKLHTDAEYYCHFHHPLMMPPLLKLLLEDLQDLLHHLKQNHRMNPNLTDRHLYMEAGEPSQVLPPHTGVLYLLRENSDSCSRSWRPLA